MKKLKGIDGQLDEAWSLLVKLEWNRECAYCRRKDYLNSHHIFSRSNRSVRWDTVNGICLCAGHHTLNSNFSAHKTPTEFTYWLEGKKGRKFMDMLTIKAHSIGKFTKFEKEIMLKDLQKRIKELEDV